LFLAPLCFAPENKEFFAKSTNPPISSSGIGGVGKVWEKEIYLLSDKRDLKSPLIVQKENIYTVGAYFIKWDLDGNIVWKKEGFYALGVYGDGEYIYTLKDRLSSSGFILSKWDSDGVSIWNQTITEWAVNPYCLSGYNESLYVLAGSYLYKWDVNGTLLWQKSGPGESTGLSISVSDAIYISSYEILSKYSLNGTIVWQLPYEEDIFVNNLECFDDHVYVVGTNTTIYPSEIFIAKISLEGEIVWERSFGGDSPVSGWSVLPFEEGVFVGGGATYPGKFLLYGLSQDGNLSWLKEEEKDNYDEPSIIGLAGNQTSFYSIGYGGGAPNSFVRWVEDLLPPTITDLKDVCYEQTDSASILSWYAIDENPSSYIIYKDGYQEAFGSWISGQPIEIQINKSSLRQYNYSIVVEDLAGYSVMDSVLVTIEDTLSPSLSGSYSNESKKIVWIANDRNPSSYIVYKDGEEVASGSWVSEGDISVIVSPEKRNSLNYSIVVSDTSGNINTDSIIIPALNAGTAIVSFFPWLEILTLIVGLAVIGTVIFLIILFRKNKLIIKEKVYIET